MRDYLLWRGSDKRPVADWPTGLLQMALRQIERGQIESQTQCTAEQMAERIKIELTARQIGAV